MNKQYDLERQPWPQLRCCAHYLLYSCNFGYQNEIRENIIGFLVGTWLGLSQFSQKSEI